MYLSQSFLFSPGFGWVAFSLAEDYDLMPFPSSQIIAALQKKVVRRQDVWALSDFAVAEQAEELPEFLGNLQRMNSRAFYLS